jgi:TP901 family phage tail tape measure protein
LIAQVYNAVEQAVLNNLNDFTDKLARTLQKSNTSIGQLGEAIQTTSGTARQTGQNIDEINAVLGVFANNGLKGSEAGTAYRNMLLALASPTDKARELMARYGITVYDSAGNMRQMSNVMTDLNAALALLSQEERTNVLSDIFNKVDLNAANFLLNSTSGEFQNLSNEIANASGAAQKMADTMEEGLSGALRSFSSFMQEQMIELGESLQTPVTDALTVVQEKIAEVMPELVRKLEEILPQVGATLAEILPLLIELGADALPVIATFLQAILPLVQMFSSFLNENSAAVRFWLPLIVEAGIAVQVLTGAVAFFKTVTAITAGLSAVAGGIGKFGHYARQPRQSRRRDRLQNRRGGSHRSRSSRHRRHRVGICRRQNRRRN